MTNSSYYVVEFNEGPYIYYGPEVKSWFVFVEGIKKKAIKQLKKEEKEMGLDYNDSNIKYRMDRLIKELGYKKQYEVSESLVKV